MFPRVRPGGGFSGTHATVASLIQFAYELKDYQIVEGPGWIRQTGSFYYTIRSQFSMAARFFGGARTELDSLPALPTALEEQLGLKLESRRGPFQVLVVDSVQQPTDN